MIQTSRLNVGNCEELRRLVVFVLWQRCGGKEGGLKVLINRAVSGSLKWSELADKQSGCRGGKPTGPRSHLDLVPPENVALAQKRGTQRSKEEKTSLVLLFLFYISHKIRNRYQNVKPMYPRWGRLIWTPDSYEAPTSKQHLPAFLHIYGSVFKCDNA